jgi:hypothetical protein
MDPPYPASAQMAPDLGRQYLILGFYPRLVKMAPENLFNNRQWRPRHPSTPREWRSTGALGRSPMAPRAPRVSRVLPFKPLPANGPGTFPVGVAAKEVNVWRFSAANPNGRGKRCWTYLHLLRGQSRQPSAAAGSLVLSPVSSPSSSPGLSLRNLERDTKYRRPIPTAVSTAERQWR